MKESFKLLRVPLLTQLKVSQKFLIVAISLLLLPTFAVTSDDSANAIVYILIL